MGDEFILVLEEAKVYFGEFFGKLNDSGVGYSIVVFYNLVYLDERCGADE